VAGVENVVETEEIGALTLKGFARPVPAFQLVRLRPA
jgi:class 3 adenylate cyclase